MTTATKTKTEQDIMTEYAIRAEQVPGGAEALVAALRREAVTLGHKAGAMRFVMASGRAHGDAYDRAEAQALEAEDAIEAIEEEIAIYEDIIAGRW